MPKEKIRKIFIFIIAAYCIIAAGFNFLAGDQLKYKESSGNIVMLEADYVTDEVNKETSVSQTFLNTVERIETIELVFTKHYRDGSGIVTIELYDRNKLLIKKEMNIRQIPEQRVVNLIPEEPIENMKNRKLTLKISSNAEIGNGVAIMMNRGNAPDGSFVKINDESIEGTLCFSIVGAEYIRISSYYWYIAFGIGVILAIFLNISYRQYCDGKNTYLVSAILAVDRYSFLIGQLVSRDFKSKYKRSLLGVLWSFLNPLLTMMVQFLVFSTFFQADTKNYPVYLLSGVVCMNFFKETTDMCLQSISGSANLINKVYIPKYIFPLSRTISSTINLGLSLIPLLLVSILMGITIRKSVLLIVFFLACLILFSLGMGMLLAALMVFFRDIQFLWGVITQIWTYATPIFYPAEIIPERYRFIVRFNPLYHFIGNLRKCLIDGISPEPVSYIYCLIFAIGMFAIGATVFKKTQDKFTLYL